MCCIRFGRGLIPRALGQGRRGRRRLAKVVQTHLVEAAVPPGGEGRAVEHRAPAADGAAFGPPVGELGHGSEYEAALCEQQQQPRPPKAALAHMQRAVVVVAAAAPLLREEGAARVHDRDRAR